MTGFQKWLNAELHNRNLSARAASMGAKIGRAQVSRYLGGKRPSAENCRKLARYFDVPEEFLLRLAGYIRSAAGESEYVAELSAVVESLPESEKRDLLEFARLRARLTKAARERHEEGRD